LLLKIISKNIVEWKAILQTISEIVDEAMFICNQDGITFRGIDPSHVSLLDITIPKSSFESYECHSTFFGVKVEDFKNIISIASNDDVLEIIIENPNKVNIRIHGSLDMKYDLGLIERSEVNLPIPKVESRSKISLSPSILSKIISSIEKISDYITINSISNQIQFIGNGDVGKAMINLDRNNQELSQLDVREDTSAIYSLEYMAKIIRDIGRTSTIVNMEYGTKTPIRMVFEMPSATKVEYYLAPRVED